MPRLSNPVTLRTLLGVSLLVFVLSTIAGAGVASQVIERGPRGLKGPAGSEGPRGRPGRADAKSVLEAIERQPGRVAATVQGHLSLSPAQLDAKVERLRADLGVICDSFALREPCKSK
jgi:hypothetical protein